MNKQSWAGKIIGAFIGFLSGGPIGLLIGLLAGNAFDQMHGRQARSAGQRGVNQNVFFRVTFLMMGQLAKSDGRVSESEIEQARFIMDQMGLNEAQRREAIDYFNEGKHPDLDLQAELQHFMQTVGHRGALVQMLLEILLSMAYADGQLSLQEKHLLDRVCNAVGISALQFELIHNRIRASQEQFKGGFTGAAQHSAHELKLAYEVLGVKQDATDAQLKKAYRKLMSQHHPDKLVAKGLPEEMMRIAKEKTQDIQTAYDKIKKARKAQGPSG